MNLIVKNFKDLSPNELYEILKLRIQVFVFDQESSYMDLDDNDQAAIHLYLEDQGEIIAYSRVLDVGVKHQSYASIGRVLAKYQKRGYGERIVKEAIRVCKESLDPPGIFIDAQAYTQGFYERFGFQKTSDTYLLDGIPHYQMILEF